MKYGLKWVETLVYDLVMFTVKFSHFVIREKIIYFKMAQLNSKNKTKDVRFTKKKVW